MNIGLIGYGKMGKTVRRLAEERGHQITSVQDPQENGLTEQCKDSTDVYIDFSTGQAVRDNIMMACREKKPLVVGTTGWDWDDEAREAVGESGICLICDSNFSPGMALFRRLVKKAALLTGDLGMYDVAGMEMHHQEKTDAPSGSARALADIIVRNFQGKEKAEFHPEDEKRPAESFHFASLRCGRIPGTHTILFDSAEDTIELVHRARNREGFARGALWAAEWALQKYGIWSFEDVMESMMRREKR